MTGSELSDKLRDRLVKAESEYRWLMWLWTRLPMGSEEVTQATIDAMKAEYLGKTATHHHPPAIDAMQAVDEALKEAFGE